MLTLDQTTLFYITLSDTYTSGKDDSSGLINNWALKVTHDARSDSRAGSRAGSTGTPALTNGSSRSSRLPASVRSALNNNIKISRDNDVIEIPDSEVEGGLSDRDEMQGAERDFAVKSPPKGKKRATSTVSQYPCPHFLAYHLHNPGAGKT